MKPSVETVDSSIHRYETVRDPKEKLFTKFLKPSLEGATTYHLILTELHLKKRNFDYFKKQGIQYAVVSELENSIFMIPEGRRKFPDIADIYIKLQDPSHATIIKTFERNEKRPGPEIRIYKILNPDTPSKQSG